MFGHARRRRARALLAALAASVLFAAPARAGVLPGAPVDGPSPDLLAVGGVALAADGGGAVVYLRRDGGVPHIYVALLTAGGWGRPLRLDAALAGPAAPPVVAAASGGRVAVAYTSGGALYASVRTGPAAGFARPQAIAPAAGDPSLSMGLSGTAYLAYSDPAGDVRAARLDRTSGVFVGLPDPLDARPAGAAPGSGPLKRPRVAVAADATGLVSWGVDEPDGLTHVLARRVYGLHVGSVVLEAGAGQLAGAPGGSADTPAVGLQDDSSYAWVAFRQAFGGGAGPGGVPTERALVRPLIGSQLGPVQPVDGLGVPVAAGDAAGPPSLAVDGFGDGLLASQRAGSGAVVGAAIGAGGWGPGQPVNQLDAARSPAPAAAVTHGGEGLIAYATASGAVDGRLFAGGAPTVEPALSRPELGPVYAPGGLALAADRRGDVIAGFLQAGAGGLRLALAAIVDPPGPIVGLTTDRFIPDARPVLRWTAARPGFSPVAYAVRLDGRVIATTTATSLRVPMALADGAHVWQAIARDRLGQETPAPPRALRIAARPPLVTLAVTGPRRAGAAIGFAVGVRAAAGLAFVVVDYGDGTRAAGTRTLHRYRRPGRYAIRVTAADRVGHRALLRRSLAVGR